MAKSAKRKLDAPIAPPVETNYSAETAGEKTYRKIRSDILFGRLPPGHKLKLDKLRADYATSVSTLREILNRLSSERLVLAEGQRGFEVAPVSIGNLREIAELRQLLECHALEQSFRERGCGMGRTRGRRSPQAVANGRADEARRPQRYRAMEDV
jgi:DNA-binding GntR family transcriptional regulator